MTEEERILAEELVKSQGLRNLMGMVALEDIEAGMKMEREVIDRDYRHNERAVWGDATIEPSGGAAEDDEMRIMAAGNVTINNPPADQKPANGGSSTETPPANGGSVPADDEPEDEPEPTTAPTTASRLLRNALLVGLTAGALGLSSGYAASYYMNRGTDTDTSVELGLGKAADYGIE